MSLVFVYGNCSYYRHVESAFYCFLLADQKQRGWTTPGKPVLFRGREGPRGSGVFCYSVQVRKPREVLIEPTEATAGLCPENRVPEKAKKIATGKKKSRDRNCSFVAQRKEVTQGPL